MDYSWFKSYDSGVPHTIDVNEYSSLKDIVEKLFQKI
jgi:hypothetical protein